MQSAKDILKGNQPEKQKREFVQYAWVCDECLKGLRGRTVNGMFVIEHGDVDTIYVCPYRDDCEQLAKHKVGRSDQIRENSHMSPDLLAKTVHAFKAEKPYQEGLKNLAAKYIQECFKLYENFDEAPWLFLGGQSGCGKTHLCAAAANAFMNKGRQVRYCVYTELTRALSKFDYDLEAEIKNAKVLFLDDLFKIEPNQGELKSIFDVIDYRYRKNLQTIISSEKTLGEIEMIDSAVAGRIAEKCGNYFTGIGKDDAKNYRKKGNQK